MGHPEYVPFYREEKQREKYFAIRGLGQKRYRKPKLVSLKAICGPGDTWDPVLTIMLPDED